MRALHVNDCAFTAKHLIAEAHRRGLPWSFLPVAAAGRTWDGPVAKGQRAVLGGTWLARLAAKAATNDLLHVHSGGVVQHTRLVPKRFVVHLHGTDIRTLQYDPRWQSTIDRALQGALAVFYSTPDLAEHTLPHRPDATYVPVPIDVDALPTAAAAPGRPDGRLRLALGAGEGLADASSRRPGSWSARSATGPGSSAWTGGRPPTRPPRRGGARADPGRTRRTCASWPAPRSSSVRPAGSSPPASSRRSGAACLSCSRSRFRCTTTCSRPSWAASPESAVEAAAAIVGGGARHDGAAARDWVRAHHSPAQGVDLVSAVYDGLATSGWERAG